MTKTKLIFSALVFLVGFAFFIEVGITFLGGEKYKVVQIQPSTLGFEDYLAQGSCTELTGGCGVDSYFDTTECGRISYEDTNTCNLEPL